ncbi:MAG: DNA-directed RNA polymerase subunit N [Candidatus Micrarchaeota archaeon]|nr:DNA-directed RNA polymerase subunit N [Candidatus Micrarchaeota archaeon]
MMFPVRCFTCGAVVADKYEEYKKRTENGETPKDVLDSLGVQRYCCRRMFLGHVDNTKEIVRFSKF